MKIFFWADANIKIGFGHFSRTLALADMLKEDFDCTFFTSSPNEYQRNEVTKVCNMVELPADDSKFEIFLGYMTGDEIVFLDNYFFTPDYEKAIKNKNCKLVVLAPADKHHYADVVINYVDNNLSHYSVEPYCNIYSGLEWAILRPPFRVPIEFNNRRNGSIVVSFGGTDQFCITEKVLALIGGNDISVLCTSKVGSERLYDFKRRGAKVYVDVDANTVAKMFETAEWSILSSSTICLEALSRGSKVIAGYYIDNQVNFYNVLMKQNVITGVGNLLDNSSISLIKRKIECKDKTEPFNIDYSLQKENYLQLFRNLC